MLMTIFVLLLILWALGVVSANTLGGFIHLLLLLAIGQAFFLSQQSADTILYSEFKQLVRDGKVQEVTVAEDRIRGQLKQATDKGRTFTTVRIQDEDLIRDLDKAGVKYTGEVASRWVPKRSRSPAAPSAGRTSPSTCRARCTKSGTRAPRGRKPKRSGTPALPLTAPSFPIWPPSSSAA